MIGAFSVFYNKMSLLQKTLLNTSMMLSTITIIMQFKPINLTEHQITLIERLETYELENKNTHHIKYENGAYIIKHRDE